MTPRQGRDNLNARLNKEYGGGVMGTRIGLTLVVLLLGSAIQPAFATEIGPDAKVVPVAMREVCTISEWGYDEVRRDCRLETLPPRRSNPALRGICTTRYGQRTCY